MAKKTIGHILEKLANSYEALGQYKEALDYYKKYNKTQYGRENPNLWISHRIGYLFWQELKRRKVFGVVTIYTATA